MSEKLNMRVSRLADDGLDAERVQETLVYRWDRILLVVGVLLLLIGILAWGGLHFLTHRAVQSKPPELTRTISAQKLPEAPAPAPAPATAAKSHLSLQASQTVKPPVAPVSPVHRTSGAQKTVSTTEPAASLESAASSNKSIPAVKHESAPVTLSHHVSKLQLTRGLDQKQPTDNLGSEVNLKGRSLVKVYLYSQLEGLKGQHIYHEWFHGQKRVARVEIHPYLQTMNASSSKYLTPAMVGRWTVKVVDQKGHLLAERQFRVVDR